MSVAAAEHTDISDIETAVTALGAAARAAARELALAPSDAKNAALQAMAKAVRDAEAAILAANGGGGASGTAADLVPACPRGDVHDSGLLVGHASALERDRGGNPAFSGMAAELSRLRGSPTPCRLKACVSRP